MLDGVSFYWATTQPIPVEIVWRQPLKANAEGQRAENAAERAVETVGVSAG
jgi:hypothetical protein